MSRLPSLLLACLLAMLSALALGPAPAAATMNTGCFMMTDSGRPVSAPAFLGGRGGNFRKAMMTIDTSATTASAR